jgi:hypothetical protein
MVKLSIEALMLVSPPKQGLLVFTLFHHVSKE